jgi:8-oxo-dGTP pyrophosphatase MutT (NUDIX family)
MSDEILKYDGHYVKVKEQTIGSNVWEKVYFKGAVVVYPFDQDGKVLLVNERRPHETPNERLKPVTGIWENQYDIFENTNRELQEEIGFKANLIKPFFEYSTSGTINNFQRYVLASNLTESKIPNPDGEDSIQSIIPYSLDEVASLLYEDKIAWSYSFLGFFKLFYMLKSKSLEQILNS